MRRNRITLLVSVLMLCGCTQVTGPVAERAMQPAGRRLPEKSPLLSLHVEVTPRLIVFTGHPGVFTIETFLTNREATQVTLTDACVLADMRGIHGGSPFTFGCIPTTISLAPGQTLSQQIDLPAQYPPPDRYKVSASLVGYGIESPPVILRVIR